MLFLLVLKFPAQQHSRKETCKIATGKKPNKYLNHQFSTWVIHHIVMDLSLSVKTFEIA